MSDPVAAWHQEHETFRVLLSALQQQLDIFHAQGQPDYGLMQEIVAWLQDFGDTFHHPREDEAFRRLVRHCPDRALPLARLKQEHVVIAHAGAELRGLLEQALQGVVTPRARIEMAAATFLVYYGNHIGLEEEDVLPLARQRLTPADWEAVRQAAPARQDTPVGQDTEVRLRALRARIAA
ncbi:MAG: hemerythrin domain-containing protein [Ramlibacter sp.]